MEDSGTPDPSAGERPPEAVPVIVAETAFDPLQYDLPGFAGRDERIVEWQSPAKVLTDYLRAVGVSEPSLSARSLLAEFRSLSDLLAGSRWRLRRAAGKRVADIIHTSRELMKAKLLEQVEDGPVVSRSRELIDLLQLEVGFLRHERLIALYVDSNSRLMRIEKIGDGALGEVPINTRKIIGCGLAAGSSGFILVHNHPSGIPTPSKADLAITARLRELGAQVELHLLDHLIIARGLFGSIEDFWREARWKDGDEYDGCHRPALQLSETPCR
jgi:DNA repair protein RadC